MVYFASEICVCLVTMHYYKLSEGKRSNLDFYQFDENGVLLSSRKRKIEAW
jgi:hypothetical protein